MCIFAIFSTPNCRTLFYSFPIFLSLSCPGSVDSHLFCPDIPIPVAINLQPVYRLYLISAIR